MARTRRPAPDGTWTVPQHPSPADIDWGLMRELQRDRTLIDLRGITELAGMNNKQSASAWWRAAQNYLSGAHRVWPPDWHVLTTKIEGPPGSPPATYFTHPGILPPPDVPGSARHGRPRWYKGTIIKWLMRTRRMTLTGEVIPPRRGHSPGRGPARGRLPVRPPTT